MKMCWCLHGLAGRIVNVMRKNQGATIFGIDLAWGETNPDGVAVLRCEFGRARLDWVGRLQGDEALLKWIGSETSESGQQCVVAIDAPIICPNLTGSRPVDRLTHIQFGRAFAGCYPANQRLCPRPHRIGLAMRHCGFLLQPDLNADRVAFEVYPHPAMVRFCGLDRIVRYKKGPVAVRREEFARLQALILGICDRMSVEVAAVEELLAAPWTKAVEDQVDAIICALIGLNHWRSDGRESEILGDPETGFLVVPLGGA